MASYQDLLDAIARVRAVTGSRDAWKNSLSGDDIATACSALSSPSALGAVLMKIVAAHPEAFLGPERSTAASPPAESGLAAEAIRTAESALAQQNSTAAQTDLQVVAAVLNAHASTADGAAELDRLQREIENAVLADADLNTSAGARELQHFLIGKLRDIRTVVDTAGLDATSKAALAAALASLYASATPDPEEPRSGRSKPEHPPSQQESPRSASGTTADMTVDSEGVQRPPWDSVDLAPVAYGDVWSEPAAFQPPAPEPAPPVPAPPPVAPVPAPPVAEPQMAPPAPGWGGGLPAGLGGGLPSGAWPDLARSDSLPPRRSFDIGDEPRRIRDVDPAGSAAGAPEAVPPESSTTDDPLVVRLPDGQTITAPSPEIADAISAALAGTTIAEAFAQQGIMLPAPGTPVIAPVDPAQLLPGDVAVMADRHALALGEGRAFLDRQIVPIASVSGPGFLGWLHPPVPGSATPQPSTPPAPEVPAPDRPPVATVPS